MYKILDRKDKQLTCVRHDLFHILLSSEMVGHLEDLANPRNRRFVR